jgi:hypothetical protein
MFEKVFSRIANLHRDSSQYKFMADHQREIHLTVKEWVSDLANNF